MLFCLIFSACGKENGEARISIGCQKHSQKKVFQTVLECTSPFVRKTCQSAIKHIKNINLKLIVFATSWSTPKRHRESRACGPTNLKIPSHAPTRRGDAWDFPCRFQPSLLIIPTTFTSSARDRRLCTCLVGHDEDPVHHAREEEIDALHHLVPCCLAQSDYATVSLSATKRHTTKIGVECE